MSIVLALLWLLGAAFLAILWATLAGAIVRAGAGLAGGPARRPGPPRPWSRGLLAGAAGYAVVVVFYAGLNAAAGRSLLLTPALLGASLLGQPTGGPVTAKTVAAYTALHLAVFLVLGVAAAWMLLEAERRPRYGTPGFLLVLALFLQAIGVALWLAAPAAAAIPPWSVLAAGLAAGLVMAGALLCTRPAVAAG